MIRCSLCMSWFHVECTGEDTQYQGVWCCNSCRTLPKYVQGMTEKIDLLVSSLESKQNTEAALRAEVQLLKAENGKLRSKLSHAEHHNNELAKLIETMSFPASSGSGTSNRHEDSPTLNPYPPRQQHPSPPEPEQPWITVPTANRFELLNNRPFAIYPIIVISQNSHWRQCGEFYMLLPRQGMVVGVVVKGVTEPRCGGLAWFPWSRTPGIHVLPMW